MSEVLIQAKQKRSEASVRRGDLLEPAFVSISHVAAAAHNNFLYRAVIQQSPAKEHSYWPVNSLPNFINYIM